MCPFIKRSLSFKASIGSISGLSKTTRYACEYPRALIIPGIINIDPKLINRINELARIKKERELTSEELAEQARLRKEYLELFRAGFKQQLDSIEVVDKNHNN